MSKKYKNPPIIEVMCLFEFIPSKELDDSIAEKIYEKIKQDYPEKKILENPSGQSINLI